MHAFPPRVDQTDEWENLGGRQTLSIERRCRMLGDADSEAKGNKTRLSICPDHRNRQLFRRYDLRRSPSDHRTLSWFPLAQAPQSSALSPVSVRWSATACAQSRDTSRTRHTGIGPSLFSAMPSTCSQSQRSRWPETGLLLLRSLLLSEPDARSADLPWQGCSLMRANQYGQRLGVRPKRGSGFKLARRLGR
jgi:hypothetical protein